MKESSENLPSLDANQNGSDQSSTKKNDFIQDFSNRIDHIFSRFAARVSDLIGSVRAFLVVVIAIAVSGFFFEFSDEWKENVDFGISIGTLMILFFLQKSQNVSDKATHLKLDELIKAEESARNHIVDAEKESENAIDRLKQTVKDESYQGESID